MIDLNGDEIFLLQGAHVWKSFTKGDITCSLCWRNGRCTMELYPTHSEKVGVLQIDLYHDISRYMDSNGSPTPWFMQDAMAGAVAMGFGYDKAAASRIMDVVSNYTPDFIKMPPCPPQAHEKSVLSGAEVTVKQDGKIIMEKTL